MTFDFAVLSRLLSSNEEWATDVNKIQPGFFAESAKSQSPKILWIGCADSRVPESVLMACPPGEIFVHRNIANQFHLNDDSAQSVLTYAVENLGVEHVIVTGHSQCGGVAGAFDAASTQVGTPALEKPLTRWLAPLIKLAGHPALGIKGLPKHQALPALVEANVRAQVENVCRSEVIARAWMNADGASNGATNGAVAANGSPQKPVYVHGWVYDLETGRLRDLGVTRGPYAVQPM